MKADSANNGVKIVANSANRGAKTWKPSTQIMMRKHGSGQRTYRRENMESGSANIGVKT